MPSRSNRGILIAIGCGVATGIGVGAGCGKDLNPKFCAAHPDDKLCGGGSDPDIDAPVVAEDRVAHVGAADEAMLINTDALTIPPSTIDTTTGVITPPLAGGLVLPDIAQEVAGGPRVMVIQAASIVIAGALSVQGDRALIIVATTTLEVNANIDAGADHEVSGPGGSPPNTGIGKGIAGSSGAGLADSGGGGGSFGGGGGIGGTGDVVAGGMPGATYGSPDVLIGGGGGGHAPGDDGNCRSDGGAGGGGFQLTAGTSITIANGVTINASGGGGFGGRTQNCNSDPSAGGGGGAGGMIFLQSPMLLGNGQLGATGGGGGGGAGTTANAGSNGGNGTATTGGTAGSGQSLDGGSGAGGSLPTGANGASSTSSNTNGGGGGGGVGRIYYFSPGTATYTTSPAAEVIGG